MLSGLAASCGVVYLLSPLAQPSVPAESVRAVQDLRLVAAVELAWAAGGAPFAPPDRLKAAGYLDPKWPRSDPRAYRLTCEVEAARAFTCFADSLSASRAHFRIDAAQTVRFERGRRPDGRSPIYP